MGIVKRIRKQPTINAGRISIAFVEHQTSAAMTVFGIDSGIGSLLAIHSALTVSEQGA